MERRFFQCFKKRVGYIMSHPVCSGEDTDTTFSFIGSVSQIFLHLNDLLFLDALTDGFNEQNIWMKSVINLFARKAMIAGLPSFHPVIETIDGLCKLQGYPLLSNPLVSQKKITMGDLIALDSSLQQFDGPRMAQDILERHSLFQRHRAWSLEHRGLLYALCPLRFAISRLSTISRIFSKLLSTPSCVSITFTRCGSFLAIQRYPLLTR